MLIQRKRIALAMDLREWLAVIGQVTNVRFIPVDDAIAVESESLSGEFHRDPADRMIVATARKPGAVLATLDEDICNYRIFGPAGKQSFTTQRLFRCSPHSSPLPFLYWRR